MPLRDLELTNVIGTGYFVRLFDPETGIRDNESQYGPLTQDDVEDQLIALGVPIEQAAPLILEATRNTRAVLRNHPSPVSDDANAW